MAITQSNVHSALANILTYIVLVRNAIKDAQALNNPVTDPANHAAWLATMGTHVETLRQECLSVLTNYKDA
jgi:hypothetical protein